MNFNIFKRKPVRPRLLNEGLIIERLQDSKGQDGRRVRVEMNNSTFINLCNAMHIGRAAALTNSLDEDLRTGQGKRWRPFNNRTHRQINKLRGLALNLIREIKEAKHNGGDIKAVKMYEETSDIT
jgi:hypothetical protein